MSAKSLFVADAKKGIKNMLNYKTGARKLARYILVAASYIFRTISAAGGHSMAGP
jgi:transposase-like protein